MVVAVVVRTVSSCRISSSSLSIASRTRLSAAAFAVASAMLWLRSDSVLAVASA